MTIIDFCIAKIKLVFLLVRLIAEDRRSWCFHGNLCYILIKNTYFILWMLVNDICYVHWWTSFPCFYICYCYVLSINECISYCSRHPEVKWAQRADKVFITVQLPDAKNAKVNLEPEGVFTFSASAGAEDHLYELKLDLFDKVNVEVRSLSSKLFIAFILSPRINICLAYAAILAGNYDKSLVSLVVQISNWIWVPVCLWSFNNISM